MYSSSTYLVHPYGGAGQGIWMLSQVGKAGGFLEFRRQRSRLLPGGWAGPFLSRCPGCLESAKT